MDFLFQYHTGPIKSKAVLAENPTWTLCFNTTLVQLKVTSGFFGYIICPKFQYHTGPIKRVLEELGGEDERSFNTTLVQLKGRCFAPFGARPPCFNTTLVQLKGWGFEVMNTQVKIGFNTTLVQLKGREQPGHECL